MVTFPFVGIGGLVAVTLLVVTLGVFAGLSRLLGAAASGLRLSIMPGIVDGIRDWARPGVPEAGGPATPGPGPEAPWEELPAGGGQLGEE